MSGRTLSMLVSCVWLPILSLGTSGCATAPSEEERLRAGMWTEMRNIQEDLNTIGGRLEQVEAGYEELRRSMRVASDAGTAGKTDADRRLEAVENRIRALDAAREADKKETIEVLSRKIADVINRQSGSPGRTSGEPRRTGGSGAAAGSPVAGGVEHVVKEGESVSGIARRYGTTVGAIVGANGLKNVNFVRAGQILVIPQ